MRIYHTKEIAKLKKSKIKRWQEGMPFIKTKLLPKIIFSLFPFGYWEETDSYLYEDDDNYYCIGKNVITSITNDLAKQL